MLRLRPMFSFISCHLDFEEMCGGGLNASVVRACGVGMPALCRSATCAGGFGATGRRGFSPVGAAMRHGASVFPARSSTRVFPGCVCGAAGAHRPFGGGATWVFPYGGSFRLFSGSCEYTRGANRNRAACVGFVPALCVLGRLIEGGPPSGGAGTRTPVSFSLQHGRDEGVGRTAGGDAWIAARRLSCPARACERPMRAKGLFHAGAPVAAKGTVPNATPVSPWRIKGV